jgi:hypothetical protein
MDAMEDEVSCPVSTTSISPAIDNPLVVTEDVEMVECPVLMTVEDGMDE